VEEGSEVVYSRSKRYLRILAAWPPQYDNCHPPPPDLHKTNTNQPTLPSGLVPAMDFSDFVNNVQDLSDLELATLLCLIAKEHCIFETSDELIDDLASELALVRACGSDPSRS
jgi:hypothetical protein